MQLSNININMKASREFIQKSELKRDEKFWINSGENKKTKNDDSLYIALKEEDALTPKDRLTKLLLERMLEQLLGKKISIEPSSPLEFKSGETIQKNDERKDFGFGYILKIEESFEESEKLSFQASVTFQNEKGETKESVLNVGLHRSFISKNSLEIRAGEALKDPIVINISGDLSLAPDAVSFDIDNDGKKERLFRPVGKNGFLAYDKNGNQKIDDASELFGTKSGNGFLDMQKLDSDKNGILDKQDAAFEGLRIWMDAGTKEERLVALGEAGVFAIYLKPIELEFTFKDDSNKGFAKARRASVAVKNDGALASVWQLDAVV